MRIRVFLWIGVAVLAVASVTFALHVRETFVSCHDQFGESHGYVDVVCGMKTDELMPKASRNIKYVYRDSGFGSTLGFRCNVDEKSFLRFARGKGLSVEETVPAGYFLYFFFFEDCHKRNRLCFAEEKSGSATGLKFIYDCDCATMYGQYCSR